ncbi:response regulator transcription factor [Candidatus Marinarcus aquaticus]|uniref:DNA-binding response regulator n=1 Tax=Candidatus Marinarcus aquaticus TaxID=2044504 RepID=A0A4Q0XS22_9BACT|nr:response regulator transcription factor [Candidatus Marinarcus aquaticus]RXJ60317.1 DNA-binding response regulator [Candidatus Marinarcus aquaticus]
MSKNEFKDLKILYVEDDQNIANNAISYLKRLFKYVYSAKDGFEAIAQIESQKPDILITDIHMPKFNGLDMIEQIRTKNRQMQIIVLSAHSQKEYLFRAIELQLAKYLVKPIRHDVLYPVLLQCAKKIKESKPTLYKINKEYCFDLQKKQLFKNKQEIKMTHKERLFLLLLCENKEQLVSYEQIQEAIWYDSVMSDDALRSLVRNLRKKLSDNLIQNISKMGYKLNSEDLI